MKEFNYIFLNYRIQCANNTEVKTLKVKLSHESHLQAQKLNTFLEDKFSSSCTDWHISIL